MDKSIFDRPENFTNRELSWLEFNQRILGEARDRKNPLFERMKFLSITGPKDDIDRVVDEVFKYHCLEFR